MTSTRERHEYMRILTMSATAATTYWLDQSTCPTHPVTMAMKIRQGISLITSVDIGRPYCQ